MSGQSHADRNCTVHRNQCGEDPRREPFEKETAVHLEGDGKRLVVTSFRKVVFEKLLRRPAFEVQRLNVLDENGDEYTVETRGKVAANQSLTVIGVTGTLPVGALSIGEPRNGDSHADIVKQP